MWRPWEIRPELPEERPINQLNMSQFSTRESSNRPPDATRKPSWGIGGEIAKYTAVLAIVGICLNIVRKKLAHFTWEQVWDGIVNIPPHQIGMAFAFTALNFIVLTGYDWIAVHYLKKDIPIRKIMVGAIVGYALSNVFGWIFGGTAVRFRLYTRWGFSWLDVIAFVSVISVTFWLGMFLLAGVAFVLLPVHLPKEYEEHLFLSPLVLGYGFLACVVMYLTATMFIRKPLKIGNQEYAFPPFRLSLIQLCVSAADFALASQVLYALLPEGTANYSTVLVSYLAAMIVTVILHVPGGFGVLEVIVLDILAKGNEADSSLILKVTCGLVLFRVIYYFLPGLLALILFLRQEFRWMRRKNQLDA
jgi:uncharacterized membrane protein YbhN (UPF0104 family)